MSEIDQATRLKEIHPSKPVRQEETRKADGRDTKLDWIDFELCSLVGLTSKPKVLSDSEGSIGLDIYYFDIFIRLVRFWISLDLAYI